MHLGIWIGLLFCCFSDKYLSFELVSSELELHLQTWSSKVLILMPEFCSLLCYRVREWCGIIWCCNLIVGFCLVSSYSSFYLVGEFAFHVCLRLFHA